MKHCYHKWVKALLRGVWYGRFRCTKCGACAVCPECYGAAPAGFTVRWCERHQ